MSIPPPNVKSSPPPKVMSIPPPKVMSTLPPKPMSILLPKVALQTQPNPAPVVPMNVTPSTDTHEHANAPPSWQKFFDLQAERNRRQLERESVQDRERRLARERKPPIKSAKVFHWDKNNSREFIRESVSKKWREGTLAYYSTKQKRYNSFENEWDCCTDFGSDDDCDSDSDGDGDANFIVDTTEIDDTHAPYRPPNASPSRISDPHEHDSEWLPEMPDEGDPCEDEILQFVHTYLGYTLPEPLPSSIPQIEPSHRKTVLKMIGMSCSTATDIYNRPRALLALDFVRRLFSRETISPEEWDLSRSN